MKTIYPMPGYSASDLTALLASRQYSFMDCYTITLVDGSTKLRYTTAQRNQSVMPVDDVVAVTFIGNSVVIRGLQFKTGLGVDVDEQQLTIDYKPTDTIQGLSFPNALRLGRLDGAIITRDRYFCSTWEQPWIAAIRLFAGNVSTLDSVGRSEAQLKVKSDLNRLNIQMPRDLYQPNCKWTLFDPGCGLVKTSYAVSGAVGAGSTNAIINWSGAVDATYTMGTIEMAASDAVTRVRTIRKATGTQLLLSYPLDYTPATGDVFTVYPGCVRTYARCGDFSNQAQFRGMPFVPIVETAA